MDRDEEIFLNRIYRVYLNKNQNLSTEQSIDQIRNIPVILYAESEYPALLTLLRMAM